MRFVEEETVPFGENLLAVSIPTNLSYKAPLMFRMVNLLADKDCVPHGPDAGRAELCIDEALTNAMVHGNKLNPDKKIHVELFCDDTRWGAIIEDEGEGFSPDQVPDPTSEEFIFREAGRGILLMDDYVDDLVYSKGGKRVLLVRKCEAAVEEPAKPAEVEGEFLEEPIRSRFEEDVAVVEVLTTHVADDNVEAVKSEINSVIKSAKSLVLDMTPVEYVSSVVLGVLIVTFKRLKSKEGQMKLCGVQPSLLKILQATHLDRLLDIHEDQAAAFAALRGQGG